MLLLPDAFTPGFTPPPDLDRDATLWFIFQGHRLLVNASGGGRPPQPAPLATLPPGLEPQRVIYMGRWGDRYCAAAEIRTDAELAIDTLAVHGLRELWGRLDDALVGLAGKALQLIDWDRCHQYCGRCGRPTERAARDRARRCPGCGLQQYPRLAPAVMVRITRGDDILLARSPRFAPGMYSVLAGFVDPGETVEQAARREVQEEVGLQIGELRYFTSQSWPFPHSLMLAFCAEYAAGEIVLEDDEIEHAAWFSRHNLPKIPPTMSIARRLIDDYLSL